MKLIQDAKQAKKDARKEARKEAEPKKAEEASIDMLDIRCGSLKRLLEVSSTDLNSKQQCQMFLTSLT